jgi:hypothetical protein
MKNKIRKIHSLLFCFLSLTAIQCSKDKLPPETQDGNNTIGCLVNGQVFKPKGSFLSSGYQCYYQQLFAGDSGLVFLVSGADLSNSSNIKGISIGISGVKITQGLQIPLTDGTQIGNGRGQYIGGNVQYEYIYYTTKILTGMMYIKKFDEINNIAAGTFWFTAVNSFGDTARVTEGRFDVKFTR